MICENITSVGGVLHFAGQSTLDLAREYGTPLYLMDEDMIRARCHEHIAAMREHFGDGARSLYASKAASFKRIYEIMREEGMGIDVVSSGEIHTAVRAGFDMRGACFHGNCKTDADIEYAMETGVGLFAIDNAEEVLAVERAAARRGIAQRVILRITPGIDPHTHAAISTGKVDSKFGSAIETGQAEEIVKLALDQRHIDLVGYHCHIGSHVSGEDAFVRAAAIMIEFSAHVARTHGYEAEVLDLGGGFAVRYVESDERCDISETIARVAASARDACARCGAKMPRVYMEPGRSIVAEAGMTLYTCGSVKRIPGYKNYISIDGGMTDDPRYALYGARYTCLPAGRMDEARDMECTIAGRCCESGDLIQEHVMMPSSIERGDIVAVCTTGAYNYSMASNYNRLPRPPIVMLSGGESKLAVRRESLDDLCRNDM